MSIEQQVREPEGSQAPEPGIREVEERFTVSAVNLLPARYAEAMAMRRARLFAVAAVVVGLLAVILGWVITVQERGNAQEEFDVTTAERAQLSAQAARFADVPKVFAQVADAKIQLQDAMGSEVRWSFFLNDLALMTPSGVALTSLDLGVPAPGSGETVGSGEAGTIGLMTVEAQALTYNTVANWLDSTAKLSSLIDPQVSSMVTTKTGDVSLVTFTSTVGITSEALSGRYSDGGQTQ